MKNKKKFLIIGSNFSFNHYEYLKNQKNSEIHICSPNIYKKKFYKSCNLSKNYKKIITQHNFHTIVCCAKPNIQKDFINLILKKKYKCKFIMLEKPLSINVKKFYEFQSYCLINKIKFYLNFTYSNLSIFKKIHSILRSDKNTKITFELNIFHHFLKHKNSSWKNFISDGGGIINYYLVHIIFAFVKQSNQIKLDKINYSLKNKFLNEINLTFKNYNNEILIINFKLDSNLYTHKYFINSKRYNYIINTNSKNWYDRYFLKKFDKKDHLISETIYKEKISKLIRINYKNLYQKKLKKDLLKYYSLIAKTEVICNKINNKIKKHDFK